MNLLRSPRFPFALTLAASLGMFGAGITLAWVLRLDACPLCILQRMLYLLLGLFSLIGLVVAAHPLARRGAAVLMAAAAATGAWVAGYQTYIQVFAQNTDCSTSTTWWEDLVYWAGDRVPSLFLSNGECSDPSWIFLGLSIAEWSLVAFLALTALAVYTLFRRLTPH